MQSLDLRVVPPRRWSEELGGIRWLPRLIDKTRAALAGTLGTYLYGQSPVDRDFLRALNMRYREFTRIVEESPDDGAVLAALRARGSLEAVQQFSETLPAKRGWFLWVLDVDDGYAGKYWQIVKAPVNGASALFTGFIKSRWPSRAIELPSKTELP
ncbi:MAG: DUF5069 domain-containing protein [Candidatus Eremiobacteraeota bacterium]|nr:DUF5069 domain-containing protein [Candidatus Eremiobacteraeota bacterium]